MSKPLFDSSCGFCTELNGIDQENNLLHRVISHESGLQSRILYETDHFVVLPTLGALVEGYLLIVSKEHYQCIGQLPDDLLSEFNKVVDQVKSVIRSVYQKNVVCFEHGAVSCTNKFGGCVNHTHLHIVPCGDILSGMIQDCGMELVPIPSTETLSGIAIQDQPYLYWEDSDGRKYVIQDGFIPSQFFRKIIANYYSVAEQWDWRQELNLENLLKTYRTLQPVFAKLS